VFLVHGEPGPQKALTELLGKAGAPPVHSPAAGERAAV
jgi:hypothetical protein